MLKLARNALGTSKCFITNNGLIEWKYIEALNKLQNEIGFKFANKLGKSHIEWENKKMNVKIAAQTLSSSTADALEFLQKQGLEEFANCGETIIFIRTKDRIFDFLNTSNPFGKGYKKPIFLNNIQLLESKLLPLIEYYAFRLE